MARITPAEYEATLAKVAKINARAEKKGFTGRVTVEAERREVEREVALGLTLTEVVYDVTLGGEAPSYNGWSLAAVLDFDPAAGLIVNTAPGVTSVNREGLTAGTCAHCNTARDRRKAYLVRNVETGEQVQVGSTCIKDFLGWSGSIAFIGDEDLREVEEGWGSYGGGEARFTVDSVLAVAWAAIKTFGFVPASSYDGLPTRSLVGLVLNPPARLKDEDRRRIEAIAALAATESIMERGAEVKAFILSDEFSGDSEYVRNLKALMAAESVSSRHLGFLASAPQAMAKAQERTLVKAAKAALPASEWIGEVGQKKVEYTGTIESIRYIQGDYGVTTLYVLRDAQGRVAKWFSSNEGLGDKQGVEVTFTGTIKSHEEYQGTKSTVFTRCKVAAA